LDVLCDTHRDSADSGEIPLKARENLTERLKATGQQTMRVPILGSTATRGGGGRQTIALAEENLASSGA
jgi:hypothetical protein